jgi:Cu+-exporting ATPase
MMMKGGCGLHSTPFGGRDTRSVRDPVCGMTVDPGRAEATRTVGDFAFQLCSQACVQKFDRDPEGYARRAGEADLIGKGDPGSDRKGES